MLGHQSTSALAVRLSLFLAIACIPVAREATAQAYSPNPQQMNALLNIKVNSWFWLGIHPCPILLAANPYLPAHGPGISMDPSLNVTDKKGDKTSGLRTDPNVTNDDGSGEFKKDEPNDVRIGDELIKQDGSVSAGMSDSTMNELVVAGSIYSELAHQDLECDMASSGGPALPAANVNRWIASEREAYSRLIRWYDWLLSTGLANAADAEKLERLKKFALAKKNSLKFF